MLRALLALWWDLWLKWQMGLARRDAERYGIAWRGNVRGHR